MRHFNNLKYMAMALFVAMLSLSFTACSDDDDDDGGSRPSIVGSWEQTNSYGTEITVTFNSNKQGSVTYTYYDSNDVPTGNETEFFEDQLGLLPTDGQKTKVGKERHVWHSLDAKNFYVNLLRFAEGYGKEYYGQVYWVVTTVNCEEDIENVRLSCGVNSAAMWWLNGEEVLMMSNDRDLVVDDNMSDRITLRKGENILRGAVFNGPGMATFCLRFVDEDGQPVKNISVTAKQK